MAGEGGYTGDFIGHWAHRLIFYEAEPWVFTVLYVSFGLAVLAAFVLAPPRWPGRVREHRTAHGPRTATRRTSPVEVECTDPTTGGAP